MRLPPQQWARVRAIFEGALAVESARRGAYVAEACASDPALREDVERMLAAHEQMDSGFLASGAPRAPAPVLEGQQIGPYLLSTLIGAGGMGVVYKARDTRLDRVVAFKVLLPEVMHDAIARERFEREARAVAALNHPNICTLHDVGREGHIDYFVMEFLDGDTLKTRLERGPLPLRRAIDCALSIARALDQAHRAGIVHRDLKPANIMLTQSGPKLLDFGVAKMRDAAVAEDRQSPSAAGTALHTTQGRVLGTVQYMSPEQLEGKSVDARSDIFAFGLVLYELLTGRRAFHEASRDDLIASILERDPPPPSSVQPSVPALLDRVVARCLAKDPRDRWQSTADVALALELVADTSADATPPPRLLRAAAIVGWGVSALLLANLVLRPPRPADGPRPSLTRLAILPPAGTVYLGGYGAPHLALSPDGRLLAFVPTPIGARARIWVRPIDALGASSIAGTEGATYPFWSPDGRSLGFFADNKLKVLDRLDSVPRVICDAPEARGGAWGSDGVLLFAPTLTGPLYRVSTAGGSPKPAVRLEPGETSHRFPTFLPDGRHFLYLVQSRSREQNVVVAAALDSTETRRLPITGSKVVYSDGYLIFDRDRSLTAERFDPSTLALSGEPVTLGDRIAFRTTVQGDAPFAVAENGTLAYWNGDEPVVALRWFDRAGHQLADLGEPAPYASIALSRDGSRVAAEAFDASTQSADIWRIDTTTGIRSRMTSGETVNWGPVWSPDGARIAFGSLRQGGPSQVYVQTAEGGAAAERLFDSTDFVGPTDWAADGARVIVQDMTQLKIGVVPMVAPRTITLPLASASLEGDGRLSPDGRWLAYSSNESGTWDVYVRSFPALDRTWRVSAAGGFRPEWRRDGTELYFLSADQQLMVAPVTPGPVFSAGPPRALFALRMFAHPPTQARQPYAVSADGRRFLVMAAVEPVSPSPVTVVLNWAMALKK